MKGNNIKTLYSDYFKLRGDPYLREASPHRIRCYTAKSLQSKYLFDLFPYEHFFFIFNKNFYTTLKKLSLTVLGRIFVITSLHILFGNVFVTVNINGVVATRTNQIQPSTISHNTRFRRSAFRETAVYDEYLLYYVGMVIERLVSKNKIYYK